MAIRYRHMRDLAEHIKTGLEAGVKSFPVTELFEVITKTHASYMGKAGARRVAEVLASVGFDVTIDYGKGQIEVEPKIPMEEIQKRAELAEAEITPKAAPTRPAVVIPAMRMFPAILRQVESIAREGWPVKKEKIERLTRLAGYKLRE